MINDYHMETDMLNRVTGNGSNAHDMNGLPISPRGTTSYKGVYYGPIGTNGEFAYQSTTSLSKDEAKQANKKTFIWYLGSFDDVRDAAYVAMQFNKNKKANVVDLLNSTSRHWDYNFNIPKWKYEAIDSDHNKTARKNVIRAAKKLWTTNVKFLVPATDCAVKIWGAHVFIDLAKKYGSNIVLEARKYLTVVEFAARFGLKLPGE